MARHETRTPFLDQPNVLHLLNTFLPGGSERQAVQLIRSLHEAARYRVHVACLRRDGPLLADLDGLGLNDVPEFPLRSFYDGNALRQVRRFARLLRDRDIALVQTHDFYTNVFGMAAARLADVPVRIAARRETGALRTPLQKRVERGAYRLAHAVVVNAEGMRCQLMAEGIRDEKIVTVYNGVDLKRVTPPAGLSRREAASMLGLPTDGRRFVTIVANMVHPVKDQWTFLRAAARVRGAVPRVAFVLAGEGERGPELRAFAGECGLSADAFFLGRCERIAELLSLSDVCVLSSTSEGFSNSVLEYMAGGRPVVATDVGSVREAVVDGDTGFLVPPGDAPGLAARIIAVLDDPAGAETMGERGRRLVRERFSCQAQLDRTQCLYEHLLTSRDESRAEPRLHRALRAGTGSAEVSAGGRAPAVHPRS
jgi:L-malate glycosyltransferase